jgi:hypothetical protein
MDDSPQELESELKALRPRRPSVLLRAKLEHDLAAPTPVVAPAPTRAEGRYRTASTFRSWKWAGWSLATAAGLALIVSFGLRQPPAGPDHADPLAAQGGALGPVAHTPPAPSVDESRSDLANAAVPPRDIYRPVKAANVLYALQDEGLVLLDGDTPARRVRARYVDTYTWKNPATNASFRWSVPRDEVRVLPTSFH